MLEPPLSRWKGIAGGIALGLALLGSFCAGRAPAQNDESPRRGQSQNTVELSIDFGAGKTKHFKQIAWSRDMTVLMAMELAKEQHPGLDFKYRGRGGTAFLTQIDDIKNEGGGSGKKNWIFLVNGKQGTKGFGAHKLMQGDKVLWKFTQYKPGDG